MSRRESVDVVDEQGNRRTVTIVVPIMIDETISGRSYQDGTPELFLDNGESVNHRPNEEWEFVSLDKGRRWKRC